MDTQESTTQSAATESASDQGNAKWWIYGVGAAWAAAVF